MGNPSRIESVRTVDSVLYGKAAVGGTNSIGLQNRVRSSKSVRVCDPPWVVYANGNADGLVDDLRAARLIDPCDRAIVLQNGDFSRQAQNGYKGSPVVVARPDFGPDELMSLCQDLQGQGRQVWVLSSALDVLKGKASIKEIRGVPLVRMASTRGMKIQRVLKRAIDIVGSSLAILLLSPLLLLISLAVKISSPGPILFKQRRMGRGGRPFVCLKFRSMTADNDQSIHKRYWEGLRVSGQEAGIDKSGNRVYKLVDDPRVTRLGRLLRRWSLDELPQIFNVLAGQMSLVGPRPCVLYEWDSYQEWHRKRLSVDAGITGLWQVTGRSIVNFDEMVLLDLYYAANWSLWTDIRLMFRTIPAVFNGEGAH
jgi:exopolysaccharide biosynthesis polyprenyl glycosylphosphotransferase